MVEGLDWVWKIVNVIGLPGVITWALYDRRKLKNQARKDEIQIEVDEANAPNKVKTSSIVTLEAELMALSRTFEMDREAKERTIKWLTDQNRALRQEIEERDTLIDKLQENIDNLKGQVRRVTANLEQVQRDLDHLRGKTEHQEKGP